MEREKNTEIWISWEQKELFWWKKNIFYNSWRAIIWWNNKNLAKNAQVLKYSCKTIKKINKTYTLFCEKKNYFKFCLLIPWFLVVSLIYKTSTIIHEKTEKKKCEKQILSDSFMTWSTITSSFFSFSWTEERRAKLKWYRISHIAVPWLSYKYFHLLKATANLFSTWWDLIINSLFCRS